MTGKKLIALRPILYQARQYEAGDELPAADVDTETLAAWAAAGSAELVCTDTEKKDGERASAKLLTATAGLPGITATGEMDPLVGRVPEQQERKVRRSAKR